ncbi:hypothetical protein LXL04_011793 [Taraxacum kok-saghyz]
MSQIRAKSPQHCAQKKLVNIRHLHKKVFFTFTAFFSSLLLLVLILWFILHPTNTKPHLSLEQADIYQLAVSGTHLLNASIQLTLVATNQNQKLGIYYDEIQLFWLPVAPSFNYELDRDQSAGRLVLGLKANGLLRWKVGPWVSGKYRFNVNCVAVLLFGPSASTAAKQGQCFTTI